jgi:glycosyltransferase involved in cell wall biosynthesis
VHLHDPELILLGLWIKATQRARVVFDCHENNVGYILQKRYLAAWLRRCLVVGMTGLERLAARTFDAIVAADDGVANLFQRRYGARRVVTLHNFPRLDLFATPAADDDTTERRFDLVYHGTIPRYHLEIAFEVAERLRQRGVEARWLLFGKCPEIEWARGELRRRGLESAFEIDPVSVPHTQVAARVRQARIGFIPLPDLPKFQHNIPTKLFEFMLLGMPTVLSDLPPSRPFVGDGVPAIMVPPADFDAYADAIAALLRDPARARSMGEAGRRRVVERFNWERESEKLFELYRTLAGPPAAAEGTASRGARAAGNSAVTVAPAAAAAAGGGRTSAQAPTASDRETTEVTT